MQAKIGRKIRTFSLARKTNILTFKKKESVCTVCTTCMQYAIHCPSIWQSSWVRNLFKPVFFFLSFCFSLFVCLVFLVLFCFVFFCSFVFSFLFSAFPCHSTGRGLVPMLSFPKNAGIVKLLMPSETGRRPRSSMLSSARNA